MTILRDPAAYRYQTIRSIAIPGMQARPYAMTQGYQDYHPGLRGPVGDFMLAQGLNTKSLLVGGGVGLLAGLGVGFFLWRRKRR